MHLTFIFKWAVHFSTLAVKLLTAVQTIIVNATLLTSLLLNTLPPV